MYCLKCNLAVENPDQQFCHGCGTRLTPLPAQTAPPGPQAGAAFEAHSIVAMGQAHVGNTNTVEQQFIHQGAQPSPSPQPPAEDIAGFKAKDIVVTGHGRVGNETQIGQQFIYQGMGPQETQKCPGCGAFIPRDRTFQCRICDEISCREFCFDAEYRCCKKCADKIRHKENRRNDLCRAKLVFSDGRTVFLLAKEQIGFGKAKRHKRPEVDIVLRLLPSRSADLDPENWDRSLKISDLHAYVAFRNGAFYIQDKSTNGTFEATGVIPLSPAGNTAETSEGSMSDITGTISEKGDEDLPKAPGVSFKHFSKDTWVALPSSCNVVLGRSGLLQLHTETFRHKGLPAALRIQRISNCTEHAYIHLVSRVGIGYGSGCAIRLTSQSYGPELAEISWDEKTLDFVLTCLVPAYVSMNGKPIAPGRPIVLQENDCIRIGETYLTFSSASDEDFVQAVE